MTPAVHLTYYSRHPREDLGTGIYGITYDEVACIHKYVERVGRDVVHFRGDVEDNIAKWQFILREVGIRRDAPRTWKDICADCVVGAEDLGAPL